MLLPLKGNRSNPQNIDSLLVDFSAYVEDKLLQWSPAEKCLLVDDITGVISFDPTYDCGDTPAIVWNNDVVERSTKEDVKVPLVEHHCYFPFSSLNTQDDWRDQIDRVVDTFTTVQMIKLMKMLDHIETTTHNAPSLSFLMNKMFMALEAPVNDCVVTNVLTGSDVLTEMKSLSDDYCPPYYQGTSNQGFMWTADIYTHSYFFRKEVYAFASPDTVGVMPVRRIKAKLIEDGQTVVVTFPFGMAIINPHLIQKSHWGKSC